MPQITINVSQQDIDTLTLAARIRGAVTSDGSPDWGAFYTPWHSDAYAQVQRTAGTMIADDPALSAQLLRLLQTKLSESANSQPAEPIEEPNA